MNRNIFKLNHTLSNPQIHQPLVLTIELLFLSLLSLLAQEIMSQRSLLGPLSLLQDNPLAFWINLSILCSFYSLALLVRKRYLGYGLIGSILLGLGIANNIIQNFRSTPLTYTDFQLFSSVFSIIFKYYTSYQIILFIVLIALAITGLIFLVQKIPSNYHSIKHGTLIFFIALFSTYILINRAYAVEAIGSRFTNIQNAYINYGFTYCFLSTMLDQGIEEPDNYSDMAVDAVIEEVHKDLKSMSTTVEVIPKLAPSIQVSEDNVTQNPAINPLENLGPDVIFVQLESFFDVDRLKAFTYNQDPLPNWHTLQNGSISGLVTVPSIGAGTANTEFEILTGMNIRHFGAGEYPYKTILTNTTTESLAYGFSSLGYHTQAIHNNSGSFYGRNIVYPNLGFDGFTSIEYMEDVAYNPIGWAKDQVLVDEIMDTLETTPTSDFIFTVTVQSHGRYPENSIIDDPVVLPTAIGFLPQMASKESEAFNGGLQIEDGYYDRETDSYYVDSEVTADYVMEESSYNQYLYYLNQMYETDQFIGDLIAQLKVRNQPTVVVFYGDHLPSLNITENDLHYGTEYQVPYLIWNNIDLHGVAPERLMSYQLGAWVTDMMDFHMGLINTLHQTQERDHTYYEDLALLQYDLLYGEQLAYNGTNPYEPTDMQMGLHPITISDIQISEDSLLIDGDYYTPYSVLEINGDLMDTVYVSSTQISSETQDLVSGDQLRIVQVDDQGNILSGSEVYILEETLSQEE